MKIILGRLARSGIEASAGSDLAAGVESALSHYARRAGFDDEPPPFPRFCESGRPDASGADLDVAVDPAVQLVLEREAQAPGRALEPERLAVHAVLVYLAELDRSGVEVLPLSARS